MARADQLRVFRNRLRRINRGQGHTFGQIVCGIEETTAPGGALHMAAASVRKGASLLSRLLAIPLGIAAAMAIGAMATVIARIGVFHLAALAETGLGQRMALTAYIGPAVLLALTGCFVLRYRCNYHMASAAMGVYLMAGAMHNLVHVTPDLWSAAFSQDWVDQIIASTERNSFAFHALMPADATVHEPPMPVSGEIPLPQAPIPQ